MEKLRTGLVGYGKVADLLSSALANIESSEFLAVCGRDINKASVYAKKWGLKAYSDVSDMVLSEKLDAVIIGTPHPRHTGRRLLQLWSRERMYW